MRYIMQENISYPIDVRACIRQRRHFSRKDELRPFLQINSETTQEQSQPRAS
jgi:hypothetical protein